MVTSVTISVFVPPGAAVLSGGCCVEDGAPEGAVLACGADVPPDGCCVPELPCEPPEPPDEPPEPPELPDEGAGGTGVCVPSGVVVGSVVPAGVVVGSAVPAGVAVGSAVLSVTIVGSAVPSGVAVGSAVPSGSFSHFAYRITSPAEPTGSEGISSVKLLSLYHPLKI